MQIRILSDLHTEFDGIHRWMPPKIENQETMTLVLAGDIASSRMNHLTAQWLDNVCAHHKHVVYVPGNHEFYHGQIQKVNEHLHEIANEIDNLHFLTRETVVLDGVRFIGATLWTDLDNDPINDVLAPQMMNDFQLIRYEDSLFMPHMWRFEHAEDRRFIAGEIGKQFDGPTVVVTHHLPSFKSIHPKFEKSQFNMCYASNLESLMWYNKIDVWFHGHTHESMDYVVGDEIHSTRVVCNPRGYNSGDPSDLNRTFNPSLVIEVWQIDGVIV